MMLGLRKVFCDSLSSVLRTWPKVSHLSARPVSITTVRCVTSTQADVVPKYANVPELQNADDTLKKVFSLDFASQSAHHKAALAQTIKDYQTRPGDTGSTPVQIAALTVRIHHLTEHMKNNRKDKSTLRTLITLVHRRRKMLVYLKRKDFQRYHEILKELNLRPPKTGKYLYLKQKNVS